MLSCPHIAALLLAAPAAAHANMEWPVIFGMNAVAFTERMVQSCNAEFPKQGHARLEAFAAWKGRNESEAARLREFNLERVRKDDPALSVETLEPQVQALEQSALRELQRDAKQWSKWCAELPGWLRSRNSDVRLQVPDFMRPR